MALKLTTTDSGVKDQGGLMDCRRYDRFRTVKVYIPNLQVFGWPYKKMQLLY